MIDFYRINNDYLDFLKQYDSQVPNIQYEKHEKFFCGTVLNVNEINYFAPISSFTIPQRTNFLILDKQKALSSVRLCFMVPVLPSVITKISIKDLHNEDPKYAILVSKEYQYCSVHEQELKKKAMSVYKIGCNKNHILNKTCCDFKKLEQVYIQYKQE